MEQSISSGQPKRTQGALMIVGAVAVGIGSGVVLNVFRPDHQDPMSAAEHTQQEERAEAQSSAPPESAPAPVVEDSASAPEAPIDDNTASSAEETAVAETTIEQDATPSFDAGESNEPAVSNDGAGATQAEAGESEAPVTAEHREKSASTTSAAVANHAARSAPPPAAQVLRPWWGSTSSDPFGVQYVGQVEGQRAVAVLFSGDVGNASELGRALKLVDESGKAVSGGWRVGNNPRLVVHSNLQPGRYTLAIDGQLASASGQSLRTPLRGPVYIQ